MNIANQGFPATRADLNNALQAIATNNSGTSAPSTTFANQWFYNETSNKLFIRNEANNAFIEVATLDQTNNEWQITTGVIQAKDGDGLALKTDDGTTRLFVVDSDGSIQFSDDIELIQAKKISFKHAAGGTTRAVISADSADNLTFGTGSSGTTRMLVDTNGNVGIGDNSPESNTNFTALTVTSTASTGGGQVYVQSNSVSSVFGADNTADPKSVLQTVTNHPLILGSNNTERARILGSGVFLISQTADVFPTAGVVFGTNGQTDIGASGNPLDINRSGTDGSIIRFFGQGTEEGEIKVLGSTVSLVGGHLSRWSQFTDGSRDTSLLRGTVMTNLDQMAVWSHDAVEATYYEEGDALPLVTEATYYEDGDTIPEGKEIGDFKTEAVYAKVGDEKTPAVDAYTEDNEQLNCMAVSSVEGDPNVAGVFEQWDEEEDGFNDLVVAMTGDNIIRIAKGTTVARGDLLISAGDGTAKPQDDDIVRSKTVAKVTSTNVSITYDDGSFCLPCVLMAC